MAVATAARPLVVPLMDALAELGISRSHFYVLLGEGKVTAHLQATSVVLTEEDMETAREAVIGELVPWTPGRGSRKKKEEKE